MSYSVEQFWCKISRPTSNTEGKKGVHELVQSPEETHPLIRDDGCLSTTLTVMVN